MKRIPKYLSYAVLIIVWADNATSQYSTPLFETIQTEPALPSMAVHAITQDHWGFLWFGTSAGLYRYDGYSALNFSQLHSDSQKVNFTTVKTILCDRTKHMWIGTPRGLFFIDLITYHITHLPAKGFVVTLYQDNTGNVWAGTQGNGVYQFDQSSNLLKHYT